MSDLGFALDGLYACGWWPSESDQCLQHSDGRWYPKESLIESTFAQSSIHLQIHQSPSSSVVEVVWISNSSGRQVVRGRSRDEAFLLAFTSLYIGNHMQMMGL